MFSSKANSVVATGQHTIDNTRTTLNILNQDFPLIGCTIVNNQASFSSMVDLPKANARKKRKCKSSFLRKQNKPQLTKFFLEDLRDQRSFYKYMTKGRVNSTDRRSLELIKRTMKQAEKEAE